MSDLLPIMSLSQIYFLSGINVNISNLTIKIQ